MERISALPRGPVLPAGLHTLELHGFPDVQPYPGGEKLPFYSKRILPLETAKRILEREVSQAKQEGPPR